MFDRIFLNFKTTLGGTAIGAAAMGAGYMILEQAHCDFSQVQWFVVLGALFGGPAVQGMFSTDNGKTVVPVGVPKAVPVILLSVMLLALVACTSIVPLGDGRFAVPETVEVRSPFGTNAGFVRLQNCARQPIQYPSFSQYEYVDCLTIHGWIPTQSQGQGGQVAIGLGLGLGGGLGAAFSGNSSSSAASSSSSVVPAAPVGGGHGGHH